MKPIRLALATAAELPKPDPESHLLVAACRQLGVEADLLPWDGETDWGAYPLVVIRTPWDYHRRLASFLAWCRDVEAETRLVNPLSVIAWNSHKRYLAELARAGLPTVPTLYLEAGSADGTARLRSCGWSEVVMKPAVSIGAIGALRTLADSGAARSHLAGLLAAGDVLVQPFLESIGTEGEISLIFFAGIYSHAIRKRPKPGDYRVQDLYGGTVHPCRPRPEEIEVAAAALAAAPGLTAYARVDLVHLAGHPVVMELELIEPELFLAAAPGAALAFAETLLGRIGA